MTQRKPVRLIAAACSGLGIGKDGRLPWRLPREFKYFLHNVGRVSRPGMMNLLVWGRLNCVAPENAYFLSEDFEGAIRLATSPALRDIIETIWVVGGTQVYKEGMMHPWCDLIYLTDVMANFDCDVFFPKIDRQLFKLQDSFPGVPSEIQEENGIKYKYQVYKKDICN
ncbi:hypothetical protein CRUP_020359 [Coryphaenoides rupestris]|nr:hypothetical protein CRUP_020359 [Coryphaenoides rupestris]